MLTAALHPADAHPPRAGPTAARQALGSAKKGTCEGFTIDEFSRLNLSVMDFFEVVAEFTDAAKLPDELATSTMIQQRIKDYYETRKP